MKSVEEMLVGKYGAVMRVSHVAKELHCHPSHVRAMCASGNLPSVKVGERWYINTAKFAAMLDAE